MINSDSFLEVSWLNILVTNDDGIYADGLWAAVKELKKIGDVTVVAPDRDQSGAGTSVTLRLPLRLHKVDPKIQGVDTFRLEGTPADCVIMALKVAIKKEIDLIVSGINEGANLGNDVFISGTVGAAVVGYTYGIPSMAVSVTGFGDIYYEAAARITAMLGEAFIKGKLPRKLFLNVNLPNLREAEIKGVELTKLGERSYADKIDYGHDGKREYYWITRAIPEWNVIPGTDIAAMEADKISLMPFPGLDGFPVGSLIQEIECKLLGKSSGIRS
jgi:5'-nucleotidase